MKIILDKDGPFSESDDEDNTNWVLCDNPECSTWYHVNCVDVDNAEDVENVMWLCPICS